MITHIPKVELHLHIEGAADPHLVQQKATKYGVNIDGLIDSDGAYIWQDFTSFLKAYDLAASVFRTPEDYTDLTYTYLAQCAAEGVIYSEVFASPDHGAAIGLSYADYIGGIAQGMERAEAEFGIIGRIIPICLRHLEPDRAVKVAGQVVNQPHPRVVGFGMAGEERMRHPKDFAPAFAICHEAGLPLTVHAGELAGAESVRAAIDSLPVQRIGHGVRAIEDAELVRRLAAEGTVLECCPGSNIALKVFPSFAAHPFAELKAAGVEVTLNSDDPPFFHTTIGREYAIAQAHLLQSDEDLIAITRAAILAAFCDANTKQHLLGQLAK